MKSVWVFLSKLIWEPEEVDSSEFYIHDQNVNAGAPPQLSSDFRSNLSVIFIVSIIDGLFSLSRVNNGDRCASAFPRTK